MSQRTRAREIVLQLLYQDDMNKDRSTDKDLDFIKNRLHNQGSITKFAKELLDGVRNKRAELDQQLSAVAENWRLGRMAATDRNVLRLGAFELLFHDPPAAVAINEAIEISKRYGNDQSSLFINGILDRLRKKCLAGDSADDQSQATPDGEHDSPPSNDEQVTPSAEPNASNPPSRALHSRVSKRENTVSDSGQQHGIDPANDTDKVNL